MKRASSLTLKCILLFSCLASASVWASPPDWSSYDRLLSKHLQMGEKNGVPVMLVDYSALARDPDLARSVALIERQDTDQLQTREQRLAFYINAYNIFALKLITDNWPINSIKDAGNWWRPVWYHNVGKIDGEAVSLDDVEHQILRPMGEPRIHMAIVCASVSCPDLRREAYRAQLLDQQLEEQTRQFLQNEHKGVRDAGEIWHVSKIFDWFDKDFEPGGIAAFIRQYRDLPADAVVQPDLEYDWAVNGE